MTVKLALFTITLSAVCVDLAESSAEIHIWLFDYSVNGRDWEDKRCDWVGNRECDPMFKFCLDHKQGSNTQFSSCSYWNPPETGYYQGMNHIRFIHQGFLLGNQVYNPTTVTLDKYLGFKFKVEVRDDDTGHSNHDLIDRFWYKHTARPALSSAQAQWTPLTLSGTRSKDRSQLVMKLLVFCKDNYYGPECDQYCVAADSDTDGHYTCDPDTGAIVCRPLWENVAEKCKVWKDDCFSNPCLNGGLCVDKYQSYVCNCSLGFQGPNCEININECQSNPCRNGGVCVDGDNSYLCNCSSQYSGTHCEFHTCGGLGCQNGGVCVDNSGNHECFCPQRYTGQHCEVDKCQVLTCQNGGHCVDGSCKCPTGYIGAQCDVEACAFMLCHNSGSCVKGKCECLPGYAGEFCHEVNECTSNPCKHNGTCYDQVNGFKCSCLPSYSGTVCEMVLKPSWNISQEQIQDKPLVKVSDNNSSMYIIILVVVIMILLFAVVIVIAVCIRQKRKRKAAAEKTAVNIGPDNSFSNPAFVQSQLPAVADTADYSDASAAATARTQNYKYLEHKRQLQEQQGAVGGSYDNSVHYDNPKYLAQSHTSDSTYPPLSPDDWTPTKPGRHSEAVDNVYVDFDGSAHNNNTNEKLEEMD